jgi:tol-pal system protein YbgF
VISSTWLRFLGGLAWVSVSFLAAPCMASAADKDVIELQREIASLSDQVHNLQIALSMLQSSFDQKLGSQGTLAQQTLDGVNQIRADNAVESKTVFGQLSQQEQKISIPVAALNTKIDQLVVSFSAAQENIRDMNSRMGRLEQQLIDLSNAVKALQTPASGLSSGAGSGLGSNTSFGSGSTTSSGLGSNTSSSLGSGAGLGGPGSGLGSGSGSGIGTTPRTPPPGVTAEGLYQNAVRDELSGKTDLALQEYTQYLQYFGDTDKAANAQYQIGEIQIHQGNTDEAINAFDTVVSHYPNSTHAPDALYEKAQALKKEGQAATASQVLRRLMLLYPESDAAGRARADLAASGGEPKD